MSPPLPLQNLMTISEAKEELAQLEEALMITDDPVTRYQIDLRMEQLELFIEDLVGV